MLQAGPKVREADGEALLVCFLQALSSGVLLSYPCPQIEEAQGVLCHAQPV